MIAIRLSLVALALAALYGLALGISVALVELAPFVGYALLIVAGGGVLYGMAGRYVDYRRDVFMHEERCMLIAAEQRRELQEPVYWIENT